MEYATERMEDLMGRYDEYITSCKYIRMPELYKTIAEMPSRRFWVSDIRAANVVSSIMRGDDVLKTMHPLRREMYEEIYRRVLELRREKTNLGISESCAIVVKQQAPKFYLTPKTVKVMVCKARKKWFEEKMRKLRLL